jgi:tripartite-type tricarboxylate transporter receptor subunit TctC
VGHEPEDMIRIRIICSGQCLNLARNAGLSYDVYVLTGRSRYASAVRCTDGHTDEREDEMCLRHALSALMFILCAVPNAALSAEYPDQPVKVVVPFPAGGFMDTVARVATDRLTQSLGKPLVIDNRGGAGGKIAEEFVANSNPDGHTLLIGLVIRPTLMQAVDTGGGPDIDIMSTFVPIGPIGSSPMLVNVSPSLGVKDFASFVAKVRSEPDKHAYASAGVGTPGHIAVAQLARQFGLKAVHAPYRGGAPALQDLAAGVVSWIVDTPTGSLPLIQAERIVPVALLNPTRIKQLPAVPTLTELGHSSFRDEVMTVYLMAPAATPKPVVDRLSAAIAELQADPEVKSRLEKISIEPAPPTDLQATRKLVHEQIEAWNNAVKQIKQAQ